jgi:MFS family permease
MVEDLKRRCNGGSGGYRSPITTTEKLAPADRRFLVLLGLPAFALSLAVTTVSGVLPVLLEAESGPLVAGALVAMEGVFALLVPPLLGPASDRAGRRLPFVAGAGALGAAALVLIGLGGPLWLVAVWIALFQIGYFAYLTPYFALYPDLVDDGQQGRAQGVQGTWREIGLGIGLVGGPLLLSAFEPAPFLLAALVLVVVTPVFGTVVARRERTRGPAATVAAGQERPSLRGLLRDHPPLRWFVAANGLWEAALAALRAFALLFITAGLGRSESYAALVLGGVFVAALLAAPLSGWLADRFGRRRVLGGALVVYAVGAVVPALSQAVYALPVIVAVAFAAVVMMTLPFALLVELLPPGAGGAGAGLFGVSRGLGLLAGPVVAGLAITLLEPVFPGTDGYASIFLVASAFLLASLPVLGRLRPGPGAAGAG